MTARYLAAFLAFGILTVFLPMPAIGQVSKAVELAGADEEDRATRNQLRKASLEQLPGPYLNMDESKSSISVKPVSQTLIRPNPQLGPEKNIAEPRPKPEPSVSEPTKKLDLNTPKPSEPVKKALDLAQKQASNPNLAVKNKVVSEPDQPTISRPYFRMDVGYGLVSGPEGTTTAGDMARVDVANLALFGAGVGYRISENLRVDVTADYRIDSDVNATTPGGAAINSDVNGMAVILNGYFDIGTFDGISPYFGGGLGIARLETAEQTGVAVAGESSTNFAWALNVGSAIDLGNSENTKMDVSYRFVSLGEFKQKDSTTYDDFMVHEFRAGFRHFF